MHLFLGGCGLTNANFQFAVHKLFLLLAVAVLVAEQGV